MIVFDMVWRLDGLFLSSSFSGSRSGSGLDFGGGGFEFSLGKRWKDEGTGCSFEEDKAEYDSIQIF